MNKTRIAIIEDEELFADSLEAILKELDPSFSILAKIGSVKVATEWLKNNPVDLIFLDIHLSDGKSFEIFENIKLEIPVIFLTSYDQYAIKAFSVNSVDYLLKPVNIDDLKRAIDKFKKFSPADINSIDYRELVKAMTEDRKDYKKRFLTSFGDKIKYIETDRIAYFFILERDIFLRDNDGSNYPVEYSLDKLQLILDPEKFFRINRKYLINISAIKNMFALGKSRIKIELFPKADENIFVSLSHTSEFRKWLNK
jgi:DNA-binding LytR/AlgR family response regulator